MTERTLTIEDTHVDALLDAADSLLEDIGNGRDYGMTDDDTRANADELAAARDELKTELKADRDPLDMTLREVADACGDGTLSNDVSLDDLPDDRPPAGNVARAFEEIHPAAAGSLLRRIEAGLDAGYTAQGASHPHFQRPLRQVLRDTDGGRDE